ncbi:MAG TPA: hypothetical protein VHN73_05880 [Phenylobacterium sp.]|nr:hypothetical protein [Phenylobacterium sp.]
MRAFAIGLACLLAGACSNLVYSKDPLFAADPAFSLEFRPGLWAAPREECSFDVAKPLAEWPECANGQRFDARGPVDDADAQVKVPEIVVAGDPIIVQRADGPGTSEKGADTVDLRYSYTAMRVSARDDAGRITGLNTWLVICGPPAEPHHIKGLRNKTTATLHPFPGLRMRGENCLARDAATVRAAAVASQAYATLLPLSAHWVRDDER